jgi:hypothetical protein
LARGVEPLGTATLFAPANGAEDEPEPAVAASPLAFFAAIASSTTFFFAVATYVAFFFIVASSAAFFFTATTSVAFFIAAALTVAFFAAAASSMASFSVAALVATAMPSVAELPPAPPGTVVHATADESGHGVVATGGVHRPLNYLCHVPSSAFAAEHHHQMILRRHCG